MMVPVIGAVDPQEMMTVVEVDVMTIAEVEEVVMTVASLPVTGRREEDPGMMT